MLAVTATVLIALIALAIPIGAALGLLAIGLGLVYSPVPLDRALGEIFWRSSNDFLIVAVPMFVLLGELVLRAGIAKRMYDALGHWLSWLPGGLMHTNVGSCAMFAATSGSSVATAATLGTVAMPECERHGYNRRLFLGTLASGGTLGILIPPSINLIVYGLLTNTSVPKLYLAGFVPGILLALLFMGTVLVACLIKPEFGGEAVRSSWQARLHSLVDLLPPLLLFLLVIGSIYAGIATPTEAAALGVVGALLLSVWTGTLSIGMLKDALLSTMRTTGVIMLIILAAVYLNFVLAAIGLTRELTQFIESLGLTPLQMIMAIVVFYIILGCFLETFSMMLTTVPLIAPIIVALGYDPIWFGILLMVLLEMALITPPIGINLYVIQGVRNDIQFNDVAIGSFPFVIAMALTVVLLIAFPQVALWLPELVSGVR
ncbi:TRAP transporter large permease [Hoeflea sp.]|uniref:TRAP transporter large permease n=1 Tax=Hoeflea sp. TaxID=1940281 RepID=UPI003B012FCA